MRAETRPSQAPGTRLTLRRIGVVGQVGHVRLAAALATLRRIVEASGAELRAEDTLAALLPGAARLAPGEVDLVVTMGGDGTLLRGARLVARFETPVLGINLGHLGFLTSIGPHEMESHLPSLFTGDCWLDERFTLQARVVGRDGGEGANHVALNDAVLHKGGLARVVRLSVRVGPDDTEVATYSSDGIIIATPTGSTAYSLSASGPIVVPSVECILATPICPHTLVIRPLILPPTAVLTVEALSTSAELILTVDGQDGERLGPGDRLVVQRGEPRVRLVRFPGQNFFTTLRHKLHWSLEPLERDRLI
jgi:NAD+ kinase